jgi:hypothetical protein
MILQTRDQEILAQGEALGLLRARREDLRALLEERFGPLSEALVERIEATGDLERLRGAMRQVMQIRSLDELDL